MTAEASRSPIEAGEQTVAPAVQWASITVNSVTGALDEASCRMERLRCLFQSALHELHELAVELPSRGGTISASTASRIFDNWMLLVVAGEKLEELEQLVTATTSKAYDDRRAVVA